MQSIRVEQLLKDDEFDLGLALVTGEAGLGRDIDFDKIQKPGLAFTGYTDFVRARRVQVLGNAEISYLWQVSPEERTRALAWLATRQVACVIVTKGLQIPDELRDICLSSGTPLFRTHLLSSNLISKLQALLEEKLAPQTVLHGVLVDVFGIGVLILGKSGIGKSECALDLIMNHHRLVADDVVDIKRKGPDVVFGGGNEIIKHHMEIRGLGILNIKDLFGVASVRDRKRIELVVELVEWSDDEEYDRIGIDERTYTILDVDIPLLTVPVRPGRNITTIIEVAARNQLLKLQGHHSALEFQERLTRAMANSTPPRRVVGDDVE
ncbi:MAG: HPr(Ser) kinase/phosphatase [Deltaproteobacteria bacterium]|nr:HPr(Ser) kinase/phosphatase [Deltaproteobacteria bacterium]